MRAASTVVGLITHPYAACNETSAVLVSNTLRKQGRDPLSHILRTTLTRSTATQNSGNRFQKDSSSQQLPEDQTRSTAHKHHITFKQNIPIHMKILKLHLVLAAVTSMTSSCHAFAQLPPEASSLTTSLSTTAATTTTTPTQLEAHRSSRRLSGPRWRSQLHATNGSTATKDNLTTSEVMSLDSIRSSLIRQEETIIFALIERAQYRQNSICYQKSGMGNLGTPPGSKQATNGDSDKDQDLSFLEYMLSGTESLHFAVRRYTSPEEHAFFPDRLPSQKLLGDLEFPQDLLSSIGGASDVNFNPILLEKYMDVIVPAVSVAGDDEQHGSTVLADIAVLQALSRRVHYGKFVAESKYQADPEAYQRLVDAGDAEGVMELLTNEVVEAKVLRRARLKAATYGTEPLLANMPPIEGNHESQNSIVAAAAASAVVAAMELGDSKGQSKLDPAIVESVYRDLIIPMTKDVEVAYLFKRCGKEPPAEYAPDRMSIDVAQL